MNLILQEESLVKAKYFEGKKPLIIPHRGGRNIVPENTLHAIENTYVEKFSHFETDLRMSKDGVVFLHHDKSFDRTTDVSGNVRDFNWEEIKKINAGSKFYKKIGDYSSTTKFVSLEDALTTYKNMKFNPAKYLREVRQEVSKVTWPSKRETFTSAGIVLVVISIAAVILMLLDQFFAFIVRIILG